MIMYLNSIKLDLKQKNIVLKNIVISFKEKEASLKLGYQNIKPLIMLLTIRLITIVFIFLEQKTINP
jgi:hypothetical protein